MNPTKEDLQEKLARWERNKPANKQVQVLEDIASMTQEMLGIMDDANKDPGKKTLIIDHVTGDDFVQILQNMQETLSVLRTQEAPEVPNYAEPVVGAVDKLEKALTGALDGLDLKPRISPNIQVAPPNVHVDAPTIDLKGVEKILRGDIPKAFKESISLIPKTPDINLEPLEKLLKEATEKLESIDTGTRIKPQFPTTLKVTNPDGSNIGGSSTTLPSSPVAFVTTVTTAGTRVQLASNALTNGGIIQAPSTNTGLIYVGGSNVSSTVYGAELQPGQSTSVAVSNSNAIYIDSSVNGEKAAFLGS